MPITAICQSCHHQFQAPDTFAGKRVKCRHCGQVFQVPAANPSGGDVGLPVDLASLESVASLEASGTLSGVPRASRAGSLSGGTAVSRSTAGRPSINTPPASASPAPNRPQQAVTSVPPAADDDGDDGDPTIPGARRPNFPVLSYPGAAVVDQALPLILMVMGLGWLALLVSGDTEAAGKPVIKLGRFVVPVLFYWAIIFPFVYGALRKAAEELNYHLPPNAKLRAFGSYLPAFVFATALWVMGEGSLPGMVVGLTMGLVLSSAIVFLLYRLRESEVATTVGYGAGGFAIGATLTVLLIMGLNYVTDVAVVKGKGQQSVPMSPYAMGLPWSAKPAADVPNPALEMMTHHPYVAPPAPTLVSNPTPDAPPAPTLSPVVSDVHRLTLPGYAAGGTLIKPLSDSPVVCLIKPAGDGTSVAVAWNVVTDSQVGVEIHLPAGQSTAAVISDGGAYLAHIVTWPRKSIRFEAFANGRTVAKKDLDPTLQDPVLLGFVGADCLVVRGTMASAPVSDLGAALGIRGGPTPVIFVEKLSDSTPPKPISIPTVADTGVTLAFSAATRRIAIATNGKVDGAPIVDQIDLGSGLPLHTINLDIDHSMAVTPTGFTYTPDGSRIGILFEHEDTAALLSYDATTGGKPAELDFPPPAGIVPKATRIAFKGNALASPDGNAWLAYGQRLIDAQNDQVSTPLMIDGVIDQRVVAGGHIELRTAVPGGGPAIQVATLDPAKYAQMFHSSPTSPGTPSTQP
jgi:hypothetical protein